MEKLYKVFVYTYKNNECVGVGIMTEDFTSLPKAEQAQKHQTVDKTKYRQIARVREYKKGQNNVIGGCLDVDGKDSLDTGRWILTRCDCARYWATIVKIYKTHEYNDSPKTTVEKVIEEIGSQNMLYALASISAFKKSDGRISGKNRIWMEEIVKSLPDDIAERSHSNPMFANLDEIHTAHIDQLIAYLNRQMMQWEEVK